MKELDIIYKIIEERFGVDIKKVKSKGNKREMVNIRRVIAIVLLNNTDLSFEKIGAAINRDHATISHYKKGTEGLFISDKQLKKDCEDVGYIFKSYNSNPEERLIKLLKEKDEIEIQIEKTKEVIQEMNLV